MSAWHQPPVCHQHHSEFISALGQGNFLALFTKRMSGSKIPKKLQKMSRNMTRANLTLSTFGLLWLLKPRLVLSTLMILGLPKRRKLVLIGDSWNPRREIRSRSYQMSITECTLYRVPLWCQIDVTLNFSFLNKAKETLVVNIEPACIANLLRKNPSNFTFCWTCQFHDTAGAAAQIWILKCKKMIRGSLDGTLTRLPDVGIFPSIYGRVPGWRTAHARTKGGFGCSPG